MIQATHTPPLGFAALTPFYDRVIGTMTREAVWRTHLVGHIGAKQGETILDVGSGTGSLAIAVTARAPNCVFSGIDPDAAAVAIARRKAELAGSKATFELGYFVGPNGTSEAVDKITSSLVLHQVPLAEKKRLLGAMFAGLRPGGQLFIADYGRQSTFAMRLAFRMTVQMFDGKSDTQPNADGILPKLIEEAGFDKVRLLDHFTTVTGRIEILSAQKSGAAPLGQMA